MRQRKNKFKKQMAILLILGTILLLTICAISGLEGIQTIGPAVEDGQQKQSEIYDDTRQRVDTGFVLTGPESYDSADTPIIVDIDEKKNTITFFNLDIERRYTLSLDGTTKLYDKYGEGLSLAQLDKGDIVDVTFLKSKKHLTTLQLSAKAWNYTDVERYEINSLRNEVTIGEEVFKLTDNTLYLSEGRTIEKMDLNAMDVLSFNGIDSTVLSIQVQKGHGYLRLLNDENFVGGWIEIGEEQIQRITDDMLLTVPEGSYNVNISHNGGGGTKSIVINRNQETALDIGDLAVVKAKQGMVLFSLTPSGASLYIDGSEADPSKPITLDYGIHQIIAKADGYKSLTQYIRVGQESAGLDVVLDKADSDESESSSGSLGSGTASSTEAVTSYYRIYVDAPESVEVYFDGNYMGISPCSFRKVAGSHEITLRKTGYKTRSYTVQVDNEEKDTSYSFADLEVDTSVSSGDSDNEKEDDED